MSSKDKGSRGGQPSMTTPIPPPWLSPQELILKRFPNELPIPLSTIFNVKRQKEKAIVGLV